MRAGASPYALHTLTDDPSRRFKNENFALRNHVPAALLPCVFIVSATTTFNSTRRKVSSSNRICAIHLILLSNSPINFPRGLLSCVCSPDQGEFLPPFALPDDSHIVVQTTCHQPALRNLECLLFPQNHVGGRNPHIIRYSLSYRYLPWRLGAWPLLMTVGLKFIATGRVAGNRDRGVPFPWIRVICIA